MMDIVRTWRAVLALAMMSIMSIGAAAQDITSEPAPAQAYVLGPGDVIEVGLIGRDDFKRRTMIDVDGTIKLPLIGTVTASNRTTRQLEQDVAALLQRGRYFARADVTVDIVTYGSRYVVVLGSVSRPGLVPVDRAYRVSEILARVGGLKDNAAEYVVITTPDAKEKRLPIVTVSMGGDKADPFVAPGDKIYVPNAELFYVYGQVNAPGVYPVLKDMNLRKALARGGGVTPAGSEKRVKVYRDGMLMKRVDLKGAVRPGDVIVVGERFF